MKNRKKLWITLGAIGGVIIALVVAGAIALGNDSVKEKIGNWCVERTFTKTIHDFPGHMMDNLDEQEDTNFVVYAKGVKRITTEAGANVIQQVDEEEKVYTIANPDEQITTLEKGDVFFMEPSEAYAPGISVKVESVEVQEEQAVITGGEIELGDVIEYADVDMILPMDKVFIAKSEGTSDAEISWVESSVPLKDTVDKVSYEEGQGGSSFQSGEMSGNKDEGKMDSSFEWFFPPVEGDLPYSLDLATGFDFTWGKANVNGKVGVRVKDVHVLFQFSRVAVLYNTGVSATVSGYVRGEVKGKIQGTLELMRIPPIPMGAIGPLTIVYEPKPCIKAEASVGGSVESYVEGRVRTHVMASFLGGVPIPYDCGFEEWGKEVDYSFAELEGSLTADVANGRLSLTALNLIGLYGETNGGVVAKGTLEKTDFGVQTGLDKPSIHECEWCVDGTFRRFLGLSVGYDLQLFDTGKKGGNNKKTEGEKDWYWNKEAGPGFDVLTGKWNIFYLENDLFDPYDEFYISKTERDGVDFGFGECPHRLWKTDVLVIRDGSKEAVPEAQIHAFFANGEDHFYFSDEGGKARIYLPNGTNRLEGESDNLRGKENVEIKDAPKEVELVLKGSGDMHILWYDEEKDPVIDSADTNSWEELENTIMKMYPEAEWYYGGATVEELCEFNQVKPGDMVLDITYDAPHTSYGIWRDDNLADGDSSNVWGEPGGWIYIGGYRICKDQNSGNIQGNMNFGLSISYDPDRKAYLTDPLPATEEFEIRAAQNTDPFYDEEYLLISYGPREEGQVTWREESIYLPPNYKTDVEAIRSIPRERRHMPQLVEEYLPIFTGAMMDQLDLNQEMVDWAYETE